LNHGSFGACPQAVLQVQNEWRLRLERQPVQFLARELEALLDAARAELAEFVGAEAQDLVFVPNATTGVNSVLQSYRLAPGDELLTTDHGYNACRNALEYVAARSGARVVVAAVPFPLRSSDEVVDAVMAKVTPKSVLALLDHVTSPTGVVFPVRRLVEGLRARGVETMVDGAHAPGMLDLDVPSLGAAYYTGNCHKWMCAPKGAAFLWVRRDKQESVRPVVISHGANAQRAGRARWLLEFDWCGTDDPTAFLSVPEAIRFGGSLLPGGWPELRRRNRELVLRAREVLCTALGVAAPAPDDMIGSLATVPLPATGPAPSPSPPLPDPLQRELLLRHGVEVPVLTWPAPPRRWLRISAQIYNELGEYQKLAAALRTELGLATAAPYTR
jgi:isopenicillin-N epimerase